MEFLEQSRQSQRKRERVVIILYSIYTMSLCAAAFHRGWEAWITGIFLVEHTAGWSFFISK